MSCPGTHCLEVDRKTVFKCGPADAFQKTMSFDSTEERLVLPVELNGVGIRHEERPPDVDRHISFTLAHELNNILTVVQGHTDHLLSKNQENTVLSPTLRKISDAAHRAAELVRTAPKLDLNPSST